MAAPKRPEARRADVDRHVSWRIRERRIILGMTLRHLAESIGVSYPQTQKYEAGKCRISAGILGRMAEALSVEVGYFYEGLGKANERTVRLRAISSLVQDFTNLADLRQQRAFLRLSRVLADAGPSHDDDVEANNG